jgi:hypothetical protein
MEIVACPTGAWLRSNGPSCGNKQYRESRARAFWSKNRPPGRGRGAWLAGTSSIGKVGACAKQREND